MRLSGSCKGSVVCSGPRSVQGSILVVPSEISNAVDVSLSCPQIQSRLPLGQGRFRETILSPFSLAPLKLGFS